MLKSAQHLNVRANSYDTTRSLDRALTNRPLLAPLRADIARTRVAAVRPATPCGSFPIPRNRMAVIRRNSGPWGVPTLARPISDKGQASLGAGKRYCSGDAADHQGVRASQDTMDIGTSHSSYVVWIPAFRTRLKTHLFMQWSLTRALGGPHGGT